jgi:predicted nucleic acid-binding protein
VTVISNTTPINYLVLIGAIDVLPELFGRVLVPSAVARELSRPKAPREVREWMAAAPAWVAVETPIGEGPKRLGAGESSVIALAIERGADLLLLDEKLGRREAERQGFSVMGTVGFIRLAGKRSLIDLPQAIARLRATNFQIAEGILDQVLAEHERQRGSGT